MYKRRINIYFDDSQHFKTTIGGVATIVICIITLIIAVFLCIQLFERSQISTNQSTTRINVLKENRIKTVAGLLSKKRETLEEMEGVGEKSIKEIEKALKKLGFKLKE